MSTTPTHLAIQDTTANPAPLGLLGFGMTTVLLNLHNSGLYPMDTMILCMGIFYGGFAQIIAGIMEWKKNNTFGMTAFISYGFFWLTLVGLILLPKFGLQMAPENNAMIAFFVMWGLFTFVMFIGTLRLSRELQVVFGSLTVLFILLALRNGFSNTSGGEIIGKIAGFEGIFCGLSALYAGLSQVILDIFKKELSK
jgi:uncharacterized protein